MSDLPDKKNPHFAKLFETANQMTTPKIPMRRSVEQHAARKHLEKLRKSPKNPKK